MTADHDFPWIMIRKNAGEVIKVFVRKDQDGPYLSMEVWGQVAFGAVDGPEQETDEVLILSLERLPALIEALEWIEGAAMEKPLGPG